MELITGLTHAVLPEGTKTTVDVLLTFRADSPGAKRAPLSLSMVIDKSGSMSGPKLLHATQAAELLIRQLGPQDTLSVVAFDNKVETVVEPTAVTDPEAIAKAVRKIRVGGSTNLSGGWLKGCELALARTDKNVIRRTLLLTDGQATDGITDPKQLIPLARQQAGEGVATTTLGFGRDFNEDLLIGMAESGGGNFYYIETPGDATQVFLIEGESLTAIGARELTLTLAPRAGVTVREVINNLPVTKNADGSTTVTVGEVYGGEDRLVAIRLEVSADAAKPGTRALLDVGYAFDPARSGATQRAEGRETVSVPVGTRAEADAATADPDVLRAVARIRVARAKEVAVERADASQHAEAATGLRTEARELEQRGLHEEFEIAEEISQLEYFAETIEGKRFDTAIRKMMRDQSYQGRTRARADLAARGSAGGSAKALETTDKVDGGVLLTCVREAGKLRMKIVSQGYDEGLKVLFPRAVREEGTNYVVEGLEQSKNGTFYRVTGKIRRLTGAAATTPVAAAGATGADPLELTELFRGGGEPWLPLLKPVIEAQPQAAEFIGPKRDKSIVPVRELTFQALKPNPPEKWKVVVFGQNPYPRVESATGIAMFDNAFGNWKDSQFGKVTSIRCIIKAAAMNKHKIAKATPIADIRKLLEKEKAVQPPEWFQAILSQGVLLMNAALTASADATRANSDEISRHTQFWKPVVEKLVEEILKAKQNADDTHKGVVFAWWGSHAKTLRAAVERLQKKYPGVPVKHIDHPNPAAQGDIFCDNDHFGKVNAALKSLNMEPIDWLPSVGWNQGAKAKGGEDADRMGDFITKTMELHKFYLERLQEVKDEVKEDLAPIDGVFATPVLDFREAVTPLTSMLKGLDHYVARSIDYAKRKVATGKETLGEHEIAALYLYTCESVFYRQMNAALRDADRTKVKPYFPYLRLLFTALGKLTVSTQSLWRGVALDLRKQYPKDTTITWWGVSSCTPKLSVAHGFLGASGKRTLFEVKPSTAVAIKAYSAFTGEEEYLLAPGSRLKVVDVKAEKSGLCTIVLEELAGERAVT